MKVNWLLAGLVVALSLSVGLLGKAWWDSRELEQINDLMNEQLMKANLVIGQAYTEFGKAGKYIGELEEVLQKEIGKRNAELTRYGVLKAKYETLKKRETGKVKIVYREKVVTIPTQFSLQPGFYEASGNQLKLIDRFYRHFNTPELSAMCEFKDNKMSLEYKLHLNFEGQLVETITPSGAVNHYFNMWTVDKDGKRIDKLQLTEYKMVVDDQRVSSFYWWAPAIDTGFIIGGELAPAFNFGGSLGFSFMGYGLTKKDLEWRFARIGIDYVGMFGVSIDPVLWNLGEFIPYINDLWISPHATYLFDNRWFFGIMIGTTL